MASLVSLGQTFPPSSARSSHRVTAKAAPNQNRYDAIFMRHFPTQGRHFKEDEDVIGSKDAIYRGKKNFVMRETIVLVSGVGKQVEEGESGRVRRAAAPS